jgi:3-phenylpropionate/trans-cinnamate dioxygenase ferredoxin reductase subunit
VTDRHIEYLLIGGGLAAGTCAATLRKEGADGSILLVGREPDLPYDRPPLSKGYLQGTESREDATMHDADWYAEREIEALTRVSVTGLDLAQRTAKLSTRETVSFGQALIATGANVKRVQVAGTDLEGIFYLRTFGNADAIREQAAGTRVVLIGGSYIASECAATLTELGARCTMVMWESEPLSRTFGPTVGRWFGDLLRRHGITILGDDALDHFEGADGKVTTVLTKNGLQLPADAVVVGTGVTPDVMLARAAGLEIGETGGVVADAKLQTATEGVYVAGDVAEYVSVVNGGRRQRVEHCDVAFNQGKTVALNMLGRNREHDAVPYFFSDLSDWAGLESVGPAYEWDREIVRGSLDDGAFTVFYLQSGVLQGAMTVGRSDDLQAARRLIAEQIPLGDGAEALGDLSADLDAISG